MQFVLIIILSFDGSTTTSAQATNHRHGETSLGNLRNTPFAVGNGYDSGNIIVEARFSNWIVLGDFPFAKSKYGDYSTLTFQDELYYIGQFENFKLLFKNDNFVFKAVILMEVAHRSCPNSQMYSQMYLEIG